ncbi:MAG: TetR/AcrR family transcriptional regulator; helix-turn-helix transcriptional regulator [Propionibacteriaceae bacterium]|nr:TetR/AcrR family transcriptional regulator; helix-turn-helix transcriptional regulator [Propionibacteriaceae bacterium]
MAEAARALSEAAASLTQALSDGFAASKSQISEAVAGGLREAAQGLALATDDVLDAAVRRPHQRRGARQAATRAKLLAAAAQLIAQRGYGGASVGDIAAAAGFTKGAFYAHFPSKEELFAQLAAQRLAEQAAALAADASQPDPDQSEPVAGPPEPVFDRVPDPDRPEIAPGQLWDQVLNLEIMAFALREPAFGQRLAPAWRAVVTAAAERFGPDVSSSSITSADSAPADSVDRESAIALLAVLSAGHVLTAVLDPDQASAATRRMASRLF